jgi:alanine racemase
MKIESLRGYLGLVLDLVLAWRVMGFVKADGYGHGLERVARAFADADAFGVASIADGLRLRAAGHAQRIVVLSGPDSAADLAELRRLGLDAVIHHDSQIEWLAADRGAPPIRVWLKIDSGMHRLGFAAERAAEVHGRLAALPAVADDIVLMTHFAASDEFDDARTARQIATFETATSGLPGARALGNSAAVLGWPAAHADWVRAGGVLYGLSVVEGKSGADFGFAPAMTLATHLVAVNRVRAGDSIGYAATWTAPEDMAIGVAAIGYGDGYPRAAPSGTPALVGHARAAIAGRVSMDLVTIDLRTAPDAKVGDPVVLWGPNLPVEEIARHAGTISYELTCGVTRRVRFVEDAS